MSETSRHAATCLVCDLGLAGYGETLDLQRRLHSWRLREDTPDVLLVLEHLPTITVGKAGSMENVLLPAQRLSDMGISLFPVDRGGDATYHGPGQLVCYPLIDLRSRGKDIARYVTDLEEVMIRTVSDFAIEAKRDPGHRGVWIGRKELGAIGISVRRWVTMHGLALNVTTNLDHFSTINPCGFRDRQATSMAEALSGDVQLAQVSKRLLFHFSAVFALNLVPVPKDRIERLCTVSQSVQENMLHGIGG